jgi:16S rRNA (uracil1498-N3)-methyltransferase
MHRIHAPHAEPPSVVVRGAEAHYIARVLRLSANAEVCVFDGRGHEWSGRLSAVTASSLTIDRLEPRAPVPEPPVQVTLAIAVLKGDQMDAVVRDATMMGASAIAPFVSAHVAVPERAWRNRSVERWVRVAIASARQCGRAVVPDVRAVTAFEALLQGAGADVKIVCIEPRVAGAVSVHAVTQRPRAVLFIGPEGGWSNDEVALARGAGAHFVGLGPRTLRAESAPTVALTALWTTWGWG